VAVFNLASFYSHLYIPTPADYASALAIELRRGSPPEVRDFLRIKFKNGTRGFEDVHVFGHYADIPLTEFIYKAEVCLIMSFRDLLTKSSIRALLSRATSNGWKSVASHPELLP
jgi:hypothetical protein